MVIRTVLEITVAALAVIGVYFLLRELAAACFSSRHVTATLVLRRPVDEVGLDILLDEAMRHPMRRPGERVVLLLSADLLDGPMGEGKQLHPPLAVVAERYRARVMVAEEIPEIFD